MPPLPHVIILHYGLHFKMSPSDDEYRRIVERKILSVKISLSNLRNGLASRRSHVQETLSGKDHESVLVWRLVTMTHFDGKLPERWQCRSPERLYALDDCAMQVVKANWLKVMPYHRQRCAPMRPEITDIRMLTLPMYPSFLLQNFSPFFPVGLHQTGHSYFIYTFQRQAEQVLAVYSPC
jgi:hypothetical protein